MIKMLACIVEICYDITSMLKLSLEVDPWPLVDRLVLFVLQQYVRDVMDGYFPSELQKRYPDGIPIQVGFSIILWSLPKTLASQ